MTAEVTTTSAAALHELPWHLPLDRWPGSSPALARHPLRFVTVGATEYVAKETASARREYEILQQLQTRGCPAVAPVAVVTDGRAEVGLPEVLVTHRLEGASRYEQLLSSTHLPTALALVDAFACLLVRAHRAGLFWGDPGLANALFVASDSRTDPFTAHLVDVETAELHPRLPEHKRIYDLELASANVLGEVADVWIADSPLTPAHARTLTTALHSAYHRRWDRIEMWTATP